MGYRWETAEVGVNDRKVFSDPAFVEAHAIPQFNPQTYRYRILALLFMATTINYLDRNLIGVLGPTLRDQVFHWSMEDYSWIAVSFQFAYVIGLLLSGGIIDRVGTKLGYTLSISVWSFFGLSHALIRPSFALSGFIAARFGLGLGEAGNFPACVKTVAQWFPKQERAFATGVFNSGSNVGAILAPLLIPLLVEADGTGWQRAFLVTGFFSAIWIILWQKTYCQPDSAPDFEKHELSEPEAILPWSKVFRRRETWAFAIAKTTDAVWWFYLFWGGMFLSDQFHLDVQMLGLPLVLIYVGADVGSLVGGWFSGALIQRGWSIHWARKTTLLLCVLGILPVMFVTQVNQQWGAVALLALAAAGHQAWSANLYALVTDVFPQNAIASVVGIGGMVGASTALVAFFTLGRFLKAGDASGYFIPFLVAGLLYAAALGILHWLMPDVPS